MAKPKYEKWLEKENLILLEGWRRDGLSLDQIAKNMGINVSTLHVYIKQHQEISEALKKGDEVCVYEVENAMYKSALGFYVEEIEVIETETDLGKTVTKKKHRRYVPPSTANQIFILKNRRSDWWKDSKVIETRNDGQLADLINGLKEPEKKEE
jgi:IS30 family transposase